MQKKILTYFAVPETLSMDYKHLKLFIAADHNVSFFILPVSCTRGEEEEVDSLLLDLSRCHQ